MKYQFFGEIVLIHIRYLYYKKGYLELWLVLDLEVHIEAYEYLRN